MIEFDIPPFLIYFLGAALIPLLGKGKVRKIFLVALAVFGFVCVAQIQPHTGWVFPIFSGIELTFLHADRLSLIMGYIFALAGGGAIIYAISTVKESGQYVCGLLYMGSALGAVFAGDFFTLYIFWEIMAFSSLGLIWYEGSKRARDSGMRYILFHLFGGCALLAGIIIHYTSTGDIAVQSIEPGIGYFLLLIGIGVNAAFIPLHTWLPDSYPKATIAGTIFLSIFTTKTGIYMLARTFSGMEAVAYMGGAMCLYGVIFAILQNDVRKLLSYHIVSQLGYMVAGVGMAGVGMGVIGVGVTGTIAEEMAINGAIAHLFNNLLFKTTLFMCMGAVIYRTGKNNLTDLGGLARKMPITMITCVIAALSISGVLFFNGYVSKGMVIHAAELKGMHILVLALTLGSVGTLISFIKLTYFAFFAKNEHIEAKEAPLPMLVPMCVTAFLCMAIGLYPKLLYWILPFKEAALHYSAYTTPHALGTVELVLMTVFLFFMLGYFAPHEKITFDMDYLYRKAGRGFIWFCENPLARFAIGLEKVVLRIADSFVTFGRNPLRAISMMIGMMGVALLKPFIFVFNLVINPVYKYYERDLEEVKMRPVEEMEKMSIGTGALLVLLFFALYLIVMFIHGWLA
uniref:NAD(P)H-quinone oxidoreductase subunit 2, chloroplastic n=1 Tax=Candidatus Methanophagaceae archaeon ANME-1 ERB6 TaxID=2759912 RepID=A0A7G9Z0I2_9EURY|nr:NAD(P)H-quinone oxidoreductase subunit 2, chloroplastic [Methanosarcinales archaeon ANME-1 ERB6]